MSEPIPFFVVDRPMSLRLLEFCGIKRVRAKIGLMGHANTSKNFQEMFRKFNGKNIVKMADSGVFTKDGNLTNDYEQLFEIYENMGVEYGIMIDVIKDRKKTIQSAKKAIRLYEELQPNFKLVGVAQGNNVEEYLKCYEELKQLGFEHVAIGGLLKKIKNSKRFVKVRDEKFLKNVVKAIRSKYPNDWLFLLGCYHPKRHKLFREYKIFGADYKGWILNYKNPNQLVQELEKELNELEIELKIKNRTLTKLKEKYYKLLRNRDKETKKELKELQETILSLRHKIAKKVNNKNYLKALSELSRLLSMSADQLRHERFKQIKNYLENNVFNRIERKKLLIISCSAKKKKFSRPAPAFEVYDGPIFRLLRKNLRSQSSKIDIIIISAKYGLITPRTRISYYDKLISKKEAYEWNGRIVGSLRDLIQKNNYSEILVCLGKRYLPVIDGLEKQIPEDCKLLYVNGRIGERMQKLKAWASNI